MELADIPRLVQDLHGRAPAESTPRYPAILAELAAADFSGMGEKYLNETRAYRTGKAFLRDEGRKARNASASQVDGDEAQPGAEPGAYFGLLTPVIPELGAFVMSGVYDPAGWCGEIQPALDRAAARAALLEAADVAARAVDAGQRGDNDTAVCLWRSVFGPDFPEPPGGCPASGTAPSAAGLASGAAAIAAPALIRRPVKDAPQG